MSIIPPSVTPPTSAIAPASLTTLEECTEESVYAPGYIQSHGLILGLQEPHLTIAYISANVQQFFGIAPASLLGQPLQRFLSRSQVNHIRAILRQNDLTQHNPFELKKRAIIAPPNADRVRDRPASPIQHFRATLHRTANTLILELEPELPEEKVHSLQFQHRLQTAILALRQTQHFTDLAQTLAATINTIIGFDRVMVYQFQHDDHGVVIAEVKADHLESFLGLHYPATDIPAPARRLFLRNWSRQIPNVNDTPAPLLAVDHHPPLDLSSCVLRGVSPYHVEYLQNMGVAGSFVISLVSDQTLWGLIVGHHYSPRWIDYETRKLCEFLGQIASVELVHQQVHELERYQVQVKAIQETLQHAFAQDPNFIHQVLTRHSQDLLNLVHAEGVAIALGQDIALVGQTPALDAVQGILETLLNLETSEYYATNCLSSVYPPAQAFQQTASGLLAISVVLQEYAYHLLWFRPEQEQTVNWAGKPQDSITIDELGQMKLCPRKSFELWKETVNGKSLPWQTVEIEAAKMMRNTLMLAALEFSQLALKQTAERAAIANRAKSQFLAKMSHELRTPLNAILGFTQVMNRSANTPTEFQEHLGIINRSGEHLLMLINDVLEMSRIEAGQLVLTKNHFNLHRFLNSVRDMFALKAMQHGLCLELEQAPDLPIYICGDEGKLRQILINLISNAIKFTPQGSVIVRAKTYPNLIPTAVACTCGPHEATPCQGLTLWLEVEDTGSGIDSQHWEGIFEAFMQTEQGRYAQGTGLGLSISRQFARLMGGDITVNSEMGQGSTFTCQVTVYQPQMTELPALESTRAIVGLEPGQPTYRILVAEDMLENRLLLTALLEPLGFDVRAVGNGAEAIALWRTWHPHLIFMDIQMPLLDGYAATREIRTYEQTQRPEPKQSSRDRANAPPLTKIIALTAYAFDNDRITSLEMGCDDHIAKPFTETTLLMTIARHLGVRYRYADESPYVAPPVEPQPLTPEDIQSVMPSAWIAHVHEAALDLNDIQIRQLLTQIPSQAENLIQGLNFLVDNFQLDAIATLTQI